MAREYSHFPDVVMYNFNVCCSHLGGFILVQNRVFWKVHEERIEGVVEDGEIIKKTIRKIIKLTSR